MFRHWVTQCHGLRRPPGLVDCPWVSLFPDSGSCSVDLFPLKIIFLLTSPFPVARIPLTCPLEEQPQPSSVCGDNEHRWHKTELWVQGVGLIERKDREEGKRGQLGEA